MLRFLVDPPAKTPPSKPAAPASWWDLLTAWVPPLKRALHYVSTHTGLPVVVVAAIALVVSWNFFRRGARFFVQVGVVLALLLIATGLGWISW